MKRVVLVFSILILWGCHFVSATPASQKNAKLGEIFELKVGESVTIADTGLSFQFDSVPEDSRCPQGPACIWAGNAVVVLKFKDGKASLNSYLEPREIIKDAYRISLLSLSPNPGKTSTYPGLPSRYPRPSSPYPKIDAKSESKESYVAQFVVNNK